MNETLTETTMTAPTTPPRSQRHRGGAPLLPPVIAYAVLTVLSVALPPLVSGVRPWASDAALLDFFRHHSGAAHLSAFLTLGAAVPLAVLTAVVTARLRTLGLDVPGRIIAQIGGTIASSCLAMAGIATLAAVQPHVADSAGAVRVLNGLTFAAGGPAFVLFVGLLVAGVAIPALIGGVLPRWLAWSGLGLGVVCEVAGTLTTALHGLDALLPIGRFGSLIWLVAVAIVLPARRIRTRP